MKFKSTRNKEHTFSFSQAVLSPVAEDGGLYVPAHREDLSPWIMHLDETISFKAIAGSLTSALLKEEFSPIISEAIANTAFPFSPKLEKLDKTLYELQLYHGPTGTHKDFSISYLIACLEHILLMQDKTALIIATTEGQTGSALAAALKNTKHLKAILLYPKGTLKGLSPEQCQNHVYPVEVDSTFTACEKLVQQIFTQKDIVDQNNLILINEVNIGRILPLTFLYTYAFSRLKQHIYGDLLYALPAKSYASLTAALYSWKFSLPTNGLITNCTDLLSIDAQNKCSILDTLVPLNKRTAINPASPSNIERLEEIFATDPMVMRALIFPSYITKKEIIQAHQELFVQYKKYFDLGTAKAYAAAKKRGFSPSLDDGSSLVLLSMQEPALDAKTIKKNYGEEISLPEQFKWLTTPIKNAPKINPTLEALQEIIQNVAQS